MDTVGFTGRTPEQLQLIWLEHHEREAFHECELCATYERECWKGEQLELEVDR